MSLLFINLMSLLFMMLRQQIQCAKGVIEVMYRYLGNGFYIGVNIGSPFEYLFLPIDISSEYTWTSAEFFNVNKSNTIHCNQLNREIIFNNTRKVYPIEVTDSLILSHGYKQSLDNFHMYLIPPDLDPNSKTNSDFKGAFGFSLSPLDSDTSLVSGSSSDDLFSIMDLHKKHDLITNRILSFVHGKYKDGTVFLGHIPNKYIKDSFHSYCSVHNPKEKRWNCNLKSVHINNTNIIYLNTAPLYFNSISHDLRAPKHFIDFIWANAYFHNECNRNEPEDRIDCPCSLLYLMNGFFLKIGDYLHEFQLSDLFKKTHMGCFFKVSTNANNANEWVLGLSFLRRNNISLDYDNRRIDFYSFEGVSGYSSPYVTALSRHKHLILSIVAVALIIVCLGWLVTATNNRKKKKLNQLRKKIEDIDHSQKEYCLNDIRSHT